MRSYFFRTFSYDSSSFWNTSWLYNSGGLWGALSNWYSSFQNWSWSSTRAPQTPELSASNFPTGIDVVEEEATEIDLSATKLKYTGKGRDVLTIEISVDSGTLEAEDYRKVTVSGSGTDTITLTGTRSRLDKYLDKVNLTYTGDENVSGDGAVSLTLGHVVDGETKVIATADVDVEDTPDDVIGTSGNDTLVGDQGVNTIMGLAGNDDLSGLAGDDIINGEAGNDVIRGGAGADTMDGGAGTDAISYEGSTTGVNVDLNEDANGVQATSGGDATGDVATGFENAYGSEAADVLTGNATRNFLYGNGGDDTINAGAGDDVVRGGAGADTMDGGDGVDIVQYAGSSAGVTVNLIANANGIQSASGGDAEGDVLRGFENVYGSNEGDTITGNAGKNVLFGYAGDDTIDGGAGNDVIRGGIGADTLEGGEGLDWLRYLGSDAGVTVDLNEDVNGLQSATGGDATGDIVSGFENVYGTVHDDRLTGNGGDNDLYGSRGADTFVFKNELGPDNVDRILDFVSGTDKVELDSAIFDALTAGAMDPSEFLASTDGEATTADQRIIHETDTGYLFYDADGLGGEDAIRFATLRVGTSIDENDFIFV